MNKSDSIANLAKALSQFQSDIKNPKNTENNPFFKSKYAPLSEILNISRPILSKYGLSVLQSPSSHEDNVTISTILMHSSGEWIEPEPLTLKADKVTAQGAGSAITYARRYAISAILGISSEDDDDGNTASGKHDDKPDKQKEPPKNDNKPNQQADGEVISENQRKRLYALSKGNNDICVRVIKFYGYNSSKEIKKADYDKIAKAIEAEAQGDFTPTDEPTPFDN